ncbi:MAG: hypothetical protein WBC29_01785 [Candidatus Moraniibacteriota bacterium]
MSRYDKYEPYAGGFRAPLAADTVAGEEFTPFAVGLDTNGRVVKGAGNTGVLGVYIAHGEKLAGDIVDVMTDGEIVEMTGTVAGTTYYGAVTGAINTTNTGTKLGATVEAARLVVRVK